MPYILRYDGDSFEIDYTIKWGDVCPNFLKPQQKWNKFQRSQQQWASGLLGFLFCSKPDLPNCQHPLSESAYISYAKETKYGAAQIVKLLSQAGTCWRGGKLKLGGHCLHKGLWLLVSKARLGSRLVMISSDRQEEQRGPVRTPAVWPLDYPMKESPYVTPWPPNRTSQNLVMWPPWVMGR